MQGRKNEKFNHCLYGCKHCFFTQFSQASVVRLESNNFGYINNSSSIYSTNSAALPYSNSMKVTSSYQGIAEFNISSLDSTNYYYLELSPRSIYSGNDPVSSIDVKSFIGDGLIGLDDYYKKPLLDHESYLAVLEAYPEPDGYVLELINEYIASERFLTLGSLTIKDPGVYSWYTPNNIGGYIGSSYLDITNLVTQSVSDGNNYLGFNVIGSDSAHLFRPPVLLSSDIPLNLSAVPIPAAVWLFGSGLIGLIGFARRKKA